MHTQSTGWTGFEKLIKAPILQWLRKADRQVCPGVKKETLCPNCGVQVGERDLFCSNCGKSLSGEQEIVLDSFGPFGVSICFDRPGFFVMAQKNNTKIFVTDRRAYGLAGSILGEGSLRFHVPYSAVLAAESFRYGLQIALWIKYQEGEKIKEVSILSGSHSHNVTSIYDLLQKRRGGFSPPPP